MNTLKNRRPFRPKNLTLLQGIAYQAIDDIFLYEHRSKYRAGKLITFQEYLSALWFLKKIDTEEFWNLLEGGNSERT